MRPLFSTLLLLLFPVFLLSQAYRDIQVITGTPLAVNATELVSNSEFIGPAWSLIDDWREARATLVFSIDESSTDVRPSVAIGYNLDVEVELWDPSSDPNGPPTSTVLETLELNYDPTATEQTQWEVFRRYDEVLQMRFKVVSLTLDDPGSFTGHFPLKLTGEIMADLVPTFNDQVIMDVLGFNFASQLYLIVYRPYGITYSDIEYVFYDEESEVGQHINDPSYTVSYDDLFAENATRVTIDAGNHLFQPLYPAGHIFYRTRAVHYTVDGERRHGPWSSQGSGTLGSFADKVSFGGHQLGNNWRASTVFAEEGKHVPGTTYVDGLLRPRQQVTLSRATNKTIIGGSIYDRHGRPALQMLPAPTNIEIINYHPRFAAATASRAYAAEDFDDECGDLLVMDGAFGIGGQQYYAADNGATGVKAYVPDAEGYPFSITEWTGDATGRVRRQSGVGETFRLGGGKETTYFYGKPGQGELDRLFGNEVGKSDNYLKNVVQDPNGQLSVSYVDGHGRTIATALAGGDPTNVSELDEGFVGQATVRTESILNNEVRGAAVVSTERTVVTSPGNHTFNYTLPANTAGDPCATDNFCYECLYDLTITVTEADCGSDMAPLYEQTLTNVRTTDFLPGCTGAEGITETFSLILAVGEYAVSKRLTLREDAVDGYADHYLNNTTCLPSLEVLTQEQFMLMDTTGCGQTCEECVASLGEETAFVQAYIADLAATGQTVDVATATQVYEARVASCDALCYLATECDAIYATMLADVSPGGQYANYVYDEVAGSISSNDETSIFYQNAFRSIGSEQYLDADGTPSQIYNLAGELVAPTDASVDAQLFLANWEPSWAETLVKVYHPEWCVYEQWCLAAGQAEADAYSAALQNTDSYAEAVDSGYVDGNGNIINDPFFAPGGPGADCVSLRDSLLQVGLGGVSILTYAEEQAYGPANGDCNIGLGGGTAAQNDYAWTIYVTLYHSIRQQLIVQKRSELDSCNVDISCIGSSTACGGSANIWATKVRRVINAGGITSGIAVDLDEVTSEIQLTAGLLIEDCEAGCAANAELWLFELGDCIASLSESQRTSLKNRLIAVCQMGCDVEHPFGASTTPNGATTSYGDASFADVLADPAIGFSSDCGAGCTVYSLSEPRPYEQPAYVGGRNVQTLNGTCACDKISALEADYDAVGSAEYDTFLDYLNGFGPEYLSAEHLSAIMNNCAANEPQRLLPGGVALPFYLECDVCLDCAEISAQTAAFLATGACTAGDDFFDDNLADYLNAQLGFSRSAEDYRLFRADCAAAGDPTRAGLIICPLPAPEEGYDEDPCRAGLLAQAGTNAQIIRNDLRMQLDEAFRTELSSACLTNLGEVFTATSRSQEYHYTLYYYDQSGNLTATVPPKGVVPLDEAALTQVQAHRDNGSGSAVYPSHTLRTEYAYNSLNELIAKSVPDAEDSYYWYDDVGRMVVSQDGRQRALSPQRYSYTRYDAQGRTIESGEFATSTVLANDGRLNVGDYSIWLNGEPASARTSVTRVYYDDVPFAFGELAPAAERNLRTRVALTSWEATNDDNDSTYDYATHYQYDASGNVAALVQEIDELKIVGQGYKRIDYEYDYISGNVHAVYYQKGAPDQYTYRYTYDADNRLEAVYSSAIATDYLDDLFWERDAGYTYYQHGPLARMELGEHRVQGVDFAYTIHGWIKGTNSSALAPERDMGSDGEIGTARALVGRDALAYTLGYFSGDYTQVEGMASKQIELLPTSLMESSGASLYNGNIRLMQIDNQAFSTHGYVYNYDQLHRIKELQTFENPDVSGTYSWQGSNLAAGYGMTASYDPNGNITALTRRGATASLLDDFTYTYEAGTNRLDWVEDQVAAGFSTQDVDSQEAGNYGYDDSGNLIRDEQSGVDDIDWLPTGKVDRITMTNNRLTRFGYGPDQSRWMKYHRDASGAEQRTFYVRDAQGNTLATYAYDPVNRTLHWNEQTLYGSDRLGVFRPEEDVVSQTGPLWEMAQVVVTGKSYELKNHLGNVLAVISDRKTGVDDDGDGTYDYYDAALLSATDYYPFGMEMPGRTFSAAAGKYRYGFNGKEQDTEGEWGGLTHYDYGFRIYNPGIAKFLSVDPLANQFAAWSPYHISYSNPIFYIDPDGRSAVPFDDYFDEKGNYLFTDTKTTQNVRIINSSDFAQLQSVYSDAMDDREMTDLSLLKELESKSKLLSELNISPAYLSNESGDLTNSSAFSIMNYYYEEAGYSLSELEDESSKAVSGLEVGSLGYNSNTGKFKLKVNREDFGSTMINRSDFLNFIAHERGGHGPDWLKHGSYNSKEDFWEWERNATRFQVSHSSWVSTSLEFKSHIYQVYGKHEYIFSKEEQ